MAAAQALALANAAAGVDHRDRAIADDEADIGDRAFVVARHQCGFAVVHEYSGRDFAHRQSLGSVPALRSICRAPRAARSSKRHEPCFRLSFARERASTASYPRQAGVRRNTKSKSEMRTIPVARHGVPGKLSVATSHPFKRRPRNEPCRTPQPHVGWACWRSPHCLPAGILPGHRPMTAATSPSNSSIQRSCGSAPIREICRSRTIRARGLRTSWPSCSPTSCRRSSTTCTFRRRPVSFG